MENKVCIYAICKDELKFLDNWYKSMSEADCIVVLDTGSTDGMWEALQDLAKKDPKVIVAQKIYKPWRFDTPRNDSMALVPEDCNILMSTDLDEILEPGWAQILRDNWVEGKHERCSYKYVWSHLPDGSPGRVFGYNKIHTRNWIWKYPVHELLWNIHTQTERYSITEELDLFDKITLHHYPDQLKSRGNYLSLLKLRKEEDSHDYYGLIYLAHEYYYYGYYQESIAELNHILNDFEGVYSALDRASCYLFMGDCYSELSQPQDAIDAYSKAIEIDPTYREPYINKAKIYLGLKEYGIARDILKEALLKTYRHYTWLERDISWTYELYDCLTQACFYSGYKVESVAYAAKALHEFPGDERLKTNLNICIQLTSDQEFYG